MALSHVHITGQTGVGPFSFSGTIALFPEHVSRPVDQIRVFVKDLAAVVTELFPKGREDSSGNFQWQFDNTAAPTEITLEDANALITGDELIILRETRMDKPVANIALTGGSRFYRKDDLNHRGNQILFLCQELRELRTVSDILGSGVGDPFEYVAGTLDTSGFSASFTADGVADTFSYQMIEMLPKAAVRHHNQLVVTVDASPVAFTADENTLKITITAGPPTKAAAIVILRVTRIDKRWVQHTDASTFSSLLMDWDFLNVKFIVEETQDFPVYVVTTNPLEQRLFARRINTISYSGPGDRFFFGNLPWFGDGTVFVFKDEILLVEFVDYTIDFLNWLINLFTDLLSTETLRINTLNPFHAFHAMPFVNPNPVVVTEVEDDFTVEGTAIILSKFADNADVLQDHTFLEIGEAQAPAPSNAKGGVLMFRTGDLGSVFKKAKVNSASIIIDNVIVNTLTPAGQFDAMDESFVGKTTYASLSSEYVTPTANPVLGTGTGPKVIDATALFQAIADLDTITEGFIILHEEPFPADAASGVAQLTTVVRFIVNYSRFVEPPANITATLDTYLDGRTAQEDRNAETEALLLMDPEDNSGAGSSPRATVAMEFNVAGVDLATVSTAHIDIKILTGFSRSSDVINVSVRRCVRTDWNLEQATWNSFKTGSAWATSGARNASSDYDGATKVGHIMPLGSYTPFQVISSSDIKQLVADAQAGDGILRVLYAWEGVEGFLGSLVQHMSTEFGGGVDGPILRFT